MVAIRGVSGGTAAGRGRAAKAAGGFRLGDGGAGVAAAAARQAEAASAAGLLALQEAPAAAERDARARRRGEGMLRGLAALQAELLAGRRDPARLRALAELCMGEEAADPALAEAVAGIALRVRVELARHAPDPPLSRD